MGTIALPSLDSILQIKDPNKRFEELVNTMGILIKNLSEINGYINSKNIRVEGIEARNIKTNTITADKMNVAELSAISANLGHIIAGMIETVTMIGSEIYGTLISTNQFDYPRAVMSNTENLFGAYLSPTNGVEVRPAGWNGVPALALSRSDALTDALISFPVNLTLNSPTGVVIAPDNGSIELRTQGISAFVYVDNWSSFRNLLTGETLQQALSSIESSVNSLWTYASGLDARITALGG
jgi:hypothetical protein